MHAHLCTCGHMCVQGHLCARQRHQPRTESSEGDQWGMELEHRHVSAPWAQGGACAPLICPAAKEAWMTPRSQGTGTSSAPPVSVPSVTLSCPSSSPSSPL